MAYYPDNWTDKELEALEKRIAEVYKQAEKDLDKEVKEYFAKFKLRDKEMKALVNAGEMTKAEYQQWRLTQMGRGQRFEALRDKVAERYTKANEVTNAYVNDMTPSIYSLNRNYEAYTIEKAVGSCDFTLWDESTVRRLLVEQPDIMPYYPPYRAIQRGIDLAYGKSQITKYVTSGIIRGLAPGKIANELMTSVTTMNRTNAVRAARTGITTAQNAGRMDSYVAAEKMGIQIKRRWVCTKDARTRLSHGLTDGQIVVGTKQPFDVGGYSMMFPGDQSLGAPGHEIYNCRCTTRTVEKDGIEAEPRQMRVRNPETGDWELVNEMTYSDWVKWKETGTKPEPTTYTKPKKTSAMRRDPALFRNGQQQSNGSLSERLEKAKTTDEVSAECQEYFRQKGSKIQFVDFGNCDPDAAKQMAEMLDSLDNKYKSSLTGVRVRWMPDSQGGKATPSNGSVMRFFQNGDPFELESEITLNETFLRSKKAIKHDFENNRRSKYGGVSYCVGTDERYAAVSSLVHEFGHTICPGKVNEMYQQQGGVNSRFMPLKRQYNTYMRELRNKQKEIQAVRESFAGQPDGLRLGIEAAKGLQDEYDAMCISRYSKESVGEFIAEAFCDAVLNSNPKPASVEVLKTIEKLYGKGE